ncbi:hypothetical protein FKM82_027481 [Ascaphus truei]
MHSASAGSYWVGCKQRGSPGRRPGRRRSPAGPFTGRRHFVYDQACARFEHAQCGRNSGSYYHEVSAGELQFPAAYGAVV